MKIDTQHPIWLAGEAGTRRELLRGAGLGIGAMALGTLMTDERRRPVLKPSSTST
jgi:hypothetical protein